MNPDPTPNCHRSFSVLSLRRRTRQSAALARTAAAVAALFVIAPPSTLKAGDEELVVGQPGRKMERPVPAPRVYNADPAARELILSNLALLEEAPPARAGSLRAALAMASGWKHSQTILTKYGEIEWNWNGPEAVEETLRRQGWKFTASRRTVGPRRTLIEDSQDGGFVIEDGENGNVRSVSLRQGKLILERFFDPKSGRIEREQIPGIFSITYSYPDDTDPQWTTRALRFAGKPGDPDVQTLGEKGAPRPSVGAFFLDPKAPGTFQHVWGEERSPSPHGLVMARAGTAGGILLASLIDFNYAGLEPQTGRVLYRRIGLGSRTARGLAHEILVTDDDVWLLLDNAALPKASAIRVPLKPRRADDSTR